ncbi:HNH endonuclease [Streptococcus iniae]|nr:HNH endonuclease [Streptococcus dysgalactiae subsp. dysgalactiae]RLU62288.1 HNH endonuclease [Streptococcus iniae]RLU63739.1 HNH endonuclease [Streptococcus iniae]RLU72101.1 HNH endonuclease [Streptococcus iniae]RLU86018.1 HNH endonuclease [Streptococcus iniae]
MKVSSTLNGNLKPFVSSYLFFRNDLSYLEYLLRIGILIELSELSYSHRLFKGFLEDIKLEYSQVSEVTTEDLIIMISEHIKANFKYDDIIQILKESDISNSILYVNEYLFALEKNFDLNLDGDIDIEHIMPQSGKNRENMQKDGGVIDASEFSEYAEKLGNKILLESDINRGIGDAWFRTKKDNNVTNRHGYIGSKFPIAKYLASYHSDTSTKIDIDVATEKAARRIADFIFESNTNI